MQETYKVPSDLTAPIHNAKAAPNPAQPAPEFDSGYVDGSVVSYQGANPGRDQDRDRQCECIPASYRYTGTAIGTEGESNDGSMEGY